MRKLLTQVCPSLGRDPEASALQSEAANDLMTQVAKLSDRDQELISLRFDAELTNMEIGEVLRMTPINVRVSIFRALNRLKEFLKADAKAHGVDPWTPRHRRAGMVPVIPASKASTTRTMN